MADRGLFIVFEGIDGSGKTEQSSRLSAWLQAQGRLVVKTREPTDGPWGRRYRAWARGETEASGEQVLDFFERDREEHVRDTIAPALQRGCVVVCDRYVASTLAYQAAQGIDRERLGKGSRAFPEPDLVLWLRLRVQQALERKGERPGERFERVSFLERVAAEYAALGLPAIDASLSPDQVEKQVREQVSRLLRIEAKFAESL